jgi:Domain of Unknown Function (DUF928)
MFWHQLSTTKLFKSIFSTTIVVIVVIGYPPPSLAASLWQNVLIFFGFRKRDVRNPSASRFQGGAGRGECPKLAYEDTNTDKRLIALIPSIKQPKLPSSLITSSPETQKSSLKLSSQEVDEVVWFSRDTIEEKPSLWFYIPYNYNEESQLEYAKLALVDEDKHLVKETPILFKLPEKAGIAQVKLPISLEVNKQYKWFFSIVCDENKPSRNPSVTGWIRRVLPEKSVSAVGQSKIPAVRYRVYAHSGLLYDAFTWLVKAYEPIKQSNENLFSSNFGNYQETLQKDWFDFFRELDLSDESSQSDERDKIVNEIAKSPISTLKCVQKSNNQICD